MKIGNIISNFLLLTSLLLVFFTVFVVNRELADGIVSGKYFWFYLSMGVLASSSSIEVVRFSFNTETRKAQGNIEEDGRNRHFHKAICFNWNDCLVLLFGLITLAVSYWMNGSEAVTKHVLLILLILLYFYFRIAFQTNKSTHYWLPVFLMITGLVEAVWGLRQLYGFETSQHGLFRLTGSFFNPGPYSCYLAVVLPVALFYFIRERLPQEAQRRRKECQSKSSFAFFAKNLCEPCGKKIRWGIAGLTLVCILLVLPAGMSRAAWLSAIGGCGVVMFFYSIQRHRRHRGAQRNWIFAVSVVLLAGCVGMYFLKKDSADGRAFIWKNAVQTVWNHPMGVGIGNFSGSYGDTQAAYFALGKGTEREEYVAGNPEYAFNEYLQMCIEHGVIPFVLFVGIVGNAIVASLKQFFNRKGRKGDVKEAIGEWVAGTGALVALMIAAALSYPFSVLPFLIVLVFLLAWIHSIIEEKGEKNKSSPFEEVRGGFLLVLSLSTALVFACLYNRYPIYNAYKQWKRYTYFQPGIHGDAVEAYRQIYPYLSDQVKFLFEYAQHLSKSEQYEESNEVLKRAMQISCDPMLYNVMGNNYMGMGDYYHAENMYLRASHIVPHRHYPLYLLMKLYQETGQDEKTKAMAATLLEKPVKIPSTAIREMQEEARKQLVIDN